MFSSLRLVEQDKFRCRFKRLAPLEATRLDHHATDIFSDKTVVLSRIGFRGFGFSRRAKGPSKGTRTI